MKHPQIALVRAKLNRVALQWRRNYYKALGLQIAEGGTLGKILCEWPKQVAIGKDCHIQDEVLFGVAKPFEPGPSIQIGDRAFIGRRCEFNCSSKITIGNDCMIASYTILVDAGHGTLRDHTMTSQPVLTGDIAIGDDVWIGAGCVILKGVSIGKGSVIGAGSVVNKSIPEYQIWAGTPARFIRDRT
ncbi:acyltransferase [Desertivirga arenae]|uniref:acyltransferase n=1 Tax=Desertivirga arenae TaxID=2810309 RepID=UPI001A9685A5|nr:acyltransferase [Pedobacter sp. SYSU D00823]